MLSLSMTLGEAIELLRSTGGATLKLACNDADDEPICAVVVANGKPETAEILAAVEKVEAIWENGDGTDAYDASGGDRAEEE